MDDADREFDELAALTGALLGALIVSIILSVSAWRRRGATARSTGAATSTRKNRLLLAGLIALAVMLPFIMAEWPGNEQ